MDEIRPSNAVRVTRRVLVPGLLGLAVVALFVRDRSDGGARREVSSPRAPAAWRAPDTSERPEELRRASFKRRFAPGPQAIRPRGLSLRAAADGAKPHLWKGLGETLIQEAPSRVLEHDGGYFHAAGRYTADVRAESVRVSGPSASAPDARLTLIFDELKAGETILARGGSVEAKFSPDRRAVSFDRGLVEERYTFRPDALEQDFVLRELPPVRGPITVTCKALVEEATSPPEGMRARRLSFTRDGKEALYVSDAVAIDAAGRRLPLELAYAAGKISITVPAEAMECRPGGITFF